jgi:hypothetical protein
MTRAGQHTLLAAALLLAACLCFSCKRRDDRLPNIDGLKDALQKSAETSIPAPTITSGKIALHVAGNKVPAEEERIINLATALDGTAVRSSGGGAASNILVRIPGKNADAFREQATGKPAQPADSTTEENQIIEISINPVK